MLLRLLSTLLVVFLGVSAALADAADEIPDVIGNQLEAFNERDIETAWSYASPNIKHLMGRPSSFAAMVERGYPMVWDNDSVRFLELREVGGNIWQKIMIRDENGVIHLLDYQMVQTREGWQINGVQILDVPNVGA